MIATWIVVYYDQRLEYAAVIFSIFCGKKLKKQEICSKILLQITRFFKFAPERWSTVISTHTHAYTHTHTLQYIAFNKKKLKGHLKIDIFVKKDIENGMKRVKLNHSLMHQFPTTALNVKSHRYW